MQLVGSVTEKARNVSKSLLVYFLADDLTLGVTTEKEAKELVSTSVKEMKDGEMRSLELGKDSEALPSSFHEVCSVCLIPHVKTPCTTISRSLWRHH